MLNNDQIKIEQPVFYQTLLHQIQRNKKNHAYLIEGYNALEYAKFLIKSLLCQNDDLCCNQCRTCLQIEDLQYIDLMYIDGKVESIKKYQIENIQKQLLKTSVEGNGKIYLIHQIENATPEAINSLLKILEEPVDGIYAVFTCENVGRVLPTIVSRTQVFRLKPLNLQRTKKLLLDKGIQEEKANILVNICSTIEEMETLANSEVFDDLIVQAMNFIEDYYFKKENLMINTQTNLLKTYKEKESIALFFDLIALGFKDVLNKENGIELVYCNHQFIQNCQDEVNKIINKIETILTIKNDLYYNANLSLTIDRLIYSL